MRAGYGPLSGGVAPLAGGALAALAFLSAPIAPWQQALGLAAAAVIALQGFRDFLRAPTVDLAVDRRGRVRYRERRAGGARGACFTGRLGASSWARRHVVVLTVELPWGPVPCAILRHRQPPGEFRRLRVWLRHRRFDP